MWYQMKVRHGLLDLKDGLLFLQRRQIPTKWYPKVNSMQRLFSHIGDAGYLNTTQDNDFILCLERSIGERVGVDDDLWKTGWFDAQVYPDLPIASTWIELFQKSVSGDQYSSEEKYTPKNQQYVNNYNKRLVRTIAAQCRSKSDLIRRLCDEGNCANSAHQTMAFLLLSGSHPVRSLPLLRRAFPDSFWLLEQAYRLRERGEIRSDVLLWGVENPISAPSRLLRKLDSGAETILTQPPFLKEKSEKWFEEAMKNKANERCQIVAGVPMISSIGNLRFWLRLCGLENSQETEALEASFPKTAGSEQKNDIYAWNAEYIRWVSK